LHQEMQGYARVSPASSNIALSWGTGKKAPVKTDSSKAIAYNPSK
jgi:hypothetical protein